MPRDATRPSELAELARELCTRWQQASLRIGWAFAEDWWAPEVEAVAEALCGGRDPAAACARLGRARAEAAVGLEEALTDLAALYAAYTGPDPRTVSRIPAGAEVPGGMVRAFALGWAEVACDLTAAISCEEPLTGLATASYLRIRLAEVYREGAHSGIPVPAARAFVVAELGPSPVACLVHLSRSVLLAHCLRTTFAGGETLCEVGPHRVLALVWRDGGLAARAAALRRLIAAELDLPADQPARVWVEGLPGTLAAAHRLVADLAR